MNDVDIKALPDDVATLKALILNQATELRYLQEQLNLALHRRFGKSSEKNPGQHELFDEPEQITEEDVYAINNSEEIETIAVPAHQRKTRGRRAMVKSGFCQHDQAALL
jgi:hypothetical protein